MKLKANYLVIPLITIIVSFLGSYFTQIGMPWYDANILKPELTPPSIAFPIAWTLIYILATISALILWNKGTADYKVLWFSFHRKAKPQFVWMIGAFALNAILNALWTYLFFAKQLIFESFIEMLVLELTIIVIMVLAWKTSRLATLLLLPYLCWVGFASYLTYAILQLN